MQPLPPSSVRRAVFRVVASAALALSLAAGVAGGGTGQEHHPAPDGPPRQPPGIANAPVLTVLTSHLTVQAAASDASLAPGRRLSLSIEITPRKGMHVYAPGKHTYQTVALTLAGQGLLEAHPLHYPPSAIYYFAPLDERVEVYQQAFTLVQDLTVLATPDAQTRLAGLTTVTIAGQLAYQACDDLVCYAPAKVPLAFTFDVAPRP